jgi:hypothetical protein
MTDMLIFVGHGGDGCGCHYLPGGAVVVTFSALGLQVKTCDRCDRQRGALLPSWGRHHGVQISLSLVSVSFMASCGYPLVALHSA